MIINFNNIGSVTGGGGTPSPSPSNYRIVDALSAITNPTEGLMAFVKAKTKVTNGVRIEISDWDAFPKGEDGRANGYLAIIQDEYWDESTQAPNSNSVFPVILIGNQFNLFKNDDNFHSANASHNGDTYNYVYKTHNGEESGYGSYIDLYMIDKPFKLWLNNGCSTAVTTTPYVEITPGQTYLYSAGQWVEIVSTTVKMEDIPLSTRADVAEFVSKVRASVARGIYPSILLGDDICTYNGDSGDFVKFAGDAGRDKVILYFSDKIYNSDGFEDRGLKGDYERRYTLPVASANELGGVKIGQGISIDQDGVISAQGGGAGGYNVVDSLPSTGSATEGALYYVKAYVESAEYRGISITTTASEGYAAHIYDGEGNEKPVYISGTNFNWGYKNDGEYHKKDDADFWYKTDNANKTFNAYFPYDTWTVTLRNNATSAETSPYTVQIPHDAQTYRFNGTGYTVAEGYDDIYLYFDYNDKDNNEKKQALINSISAVKAENRKNIKLFVSNLSSEYIKSLEGDPYIQFIPAFLSQGSAVFTASILPFNGGGNLEDPVFINCHVDFNGGLDFQMVQAPSLFVFNVDPVNHSLDSNGESWYAISCTLGDSGKRNGPIIQLVYNGRIFNAVYKGTGLSHNYRGGIYLDAKHEGKNLHGVWNVGYDNCTLIEWSENPDSYQSVSELSNAGIDTASFVDDKYSVPANVITSLTGETELFVNIVYDAKCRVTTDGTAIKMYGEDGAGGWVLRGSGTWADSSIQTTDIEYSPNISYITTGSTTYQFTFVYGDYGDPGITISKTPFYKPFEGLLAFDQSNSSLNLYAGGQWRTVYPQA